MPALIEALKDEDKWVRRRAAWALGENSDKSAITPLKEQLNGEQEGYVRTELIEAIEKLEGN